MQKNHIFKSIIILFIFLSLTITIFITPISAIVTGSVDPIVITQLFDQSNFTYISKYENGVTTVAPSTQLVTRHFFPYYTGSTNMTEDEARINFYGRKGNTDYSSFNYTAGASNRINFYIPMGIYGAEEISFQFMFSTTNTYDDVVFHGMNKSLGSTVFLSAILKDGTALDLRYNTYEYQGISEYGTSFNNGTGNTATLFAKVFDVNVTNVDIDYIIVSIYFQSSMTYQAVASIEYGLTKLFYTGANTQLTDISDKIADLIGQIQDSNDNQLEFQDTLLSVTPEGELIIEEVNDKVSDAEEGLGEIIDVLDSIEKPPAAELLPDQQIIMGQYIDSGGQEGIDSVITPLFEEGGAIYIMLFSVLSIALVSYVLFGKKAR